MKPAYGERRVGIDDLHRTVGGSAGAESLDEEARERQLPFAEIRHVDELAGRADPIRADVAQCDAQLIVCGRLSWSTSKSAALEVGDVPAILVGHRGVDLDELDRNAERGRASDIGSAGAGCCSAPGAVEPMTIRPQTAVPPPLEGSASISPQGRSLL